MSDMLQFNSSLLELKLSGMKSTPLRVNIDKVSLHFLTDDKIQEKGAKALGQALKVNKTLRSLDLSGLKKPNQID